MSEFNNLPIDEERKRSEVICGELIDLLKGHMGCEVEMRREKQTIACHAVGLVMGRQRTSGVLPELVDRVLIC